MPFGRNGHTSGLYIVPRTADKHYEAAQAIEPYYDVRKLVADGRRRSKQERLKQQATLQRTETKAQSVQTDQDVEELKRLKIRVEQLLAKTHSKE